jgi:hypothetical protein
MIYNISVVAMLSVLSIFLFVVLANTAVVIYAQKVPTNTQQTPPPPPPSSSSSITKLQTVKITSPAKGQQVPIGENLTVFGITGTAVGSTALSHCQVFVIANSVKPYQPATGTGPGGAADYSKWNFVLTSKYTTIKSGPDNKITAKYICSNNPSAVSYYSVNVTGGVTSTSVGASNNNISPPTTTATVSKQEGQPVTTTGNNSVGGNGKMTSTSSALHPTKLVYLGINKRLSHNHGIVPPIDQGGSNPSIDQGGSTMTATTRPVDHGSTITSANSKSEFTPYLFPFGP